MRNGLAVKSKLCGNTIMQSNTLLFSHVIFLRIEMRSPKSKVQSSNPCLQVGRKSKVQTILDFVIWILDLIIYVRPFSCHTLVVCHSRFRFSRAAGYDTDFFPFCRPRLYLLQSYRDPFSLLPRLVFNKYPYPSLYPSIPH